MQIEFNNFIKDSFDFKKFPKLTIEDITKGGKRDYLPLTEYKELNSELNQKVQKEINTILENTQVITKLFDEDQIKESDYDNLLKKYKIVKKHYYFLKKLTDKNEARKILDDLKRENDNLKELNKINSQTYTKEIKQLDSKLQKTEKELNQKREEITTKNKTISNLQKKISSYKNNISQNNSKNIDR
jgi:uncharacterized protein (DUF3084 family)